MTAPFQLTQPVIYDRALHEQLLKTAVTDLETTKDQQLLVLDADDDLRTAFHQLVDHKVHSAPVYDSVAKEWIGLVDMRDYLAYLVRLYESQGKLLASRVRQLANFSEQNPWLCVYSDQNLEQVFQRFGRFRFHRMPMMQRGSNNVEKMYFSWDNLFNPAQVSQSDLVAWLAKTMRSLHTVSGTCQAVQLDIGSQMDYVYSVSSNVKLLEVFRFLSHHNVNGCAVINNRGELIGNVSVSDLQYSVEESLENLDKPVGEFLASHPNVHSPPVMCSKFCTFAEICEKLAQEKVYRIYQIDNQGIPVRVITLTDIIDCVNRVTKKE